MGDGFCFYCDYCNFIDCEHGQVSVEGKPEKVLIKLRMFPEDT